MTKQLPIDNTRPAPPPVPGLGGGFAPKPGLDGKGDQGDPKKGARHHRRSLASPCDRPPATPGNVQLNFHVREAKTHLNYGGRITWDDVNTDTSGFTINTVDRWEVQWRARDKDGDLVKQEHAGLTFVTNPAGDTYRFTTSHNQNWAVGDRVKVTGCFPETDYNGTWTITNRVAPNRIDVKGQQTGLPDAKRPGEIFNLSTDQTYERKLRNPVNKIALKSAKMVVTTPAHKNITSIKNIGGTIWRVKVVTPPHGFTEQDFVKISGASPGAYNGIWNVRNIIDTDEFEVTGDTAGLADSTAGDVYRAETVFEYVTRGDNGFNPGQPIKVENCRPETAYNGNWTVSSTPGTDTFRVSSSRAPNLPLNDAEVPGRVLNREDQLHVVIGHVPRPKSWSWEARVRCRSGEGCWSDYSPWTPLQLPYQDAEPKPPIPDYGLAPITFDHHGKRKHDKIRMLFTFDEVLNWDVPGGDREDDLAGYDVRVDSSTDGGLSWEGPAYRVHRFPAKINNDADTTVTAVFHRINRHWRYRASVRSRDRFGRRGDWSNWTPSALPFDDTNPAAPTNVETWDVNTDRVAVAWDDPVVRLETRGTASVSSGSQTVTGTGTSFPAEVDAGSIVVFSNDLTTSYIVRSTSGGSGMTLTTPYTGPTASGVTVFVLDDDPDVAFYECQIAKGSQVDTSTNPNTWNGIYAKTRTRSTRVSFKVPDADKINRFHARVRSVDAARNRSPWIAAWIRANHGGLANNSAVTGGDNSGITTPIQGDGHQPSSSPAANAAGYVGYIAVWWLAVPNSDPVTYDIHISTTSGFLPSSTTLVGSTEGLSASIVRYADGSALVPTTSYFVKIVARDYDGPAALTGGTTGQAGPVSTKSQISDGVPPSTSPAVFLSASGNFIKANWNEIPNADPVDYEIHVSTTPGFVPTAGATATLFAVVNDSTTVLITRVPPMTTGGAPLIPGVPYFVSIIARDFDPGSAPPSTAVGITAPGQISDGSFPAATPAITSVVSGVGYIQPVWTPLTYGILSSTSNPDPVIYEVYCSASGLASPPAAGTKVGETSGSNFYIKRLGTADANAELAYDQPYNVKIRARDPDGQAVNASANATGTPLKVNTGDIHVDAIHAEQIYTGSVTADHLESNLVLGGTVVAANIPQTTPPTPYDTVNRIEVSGTTGLRVIMDDGTTEFYPVQLPLDGSPAKFKGGIDADTIDASGPVTLASAGNAMQPGSVLALTGGVSNPTAAPGVSAAWPTLQLGTHDLGTHHGLAYWPTGGAGGATQVLYSSLFNSSTGKWEVNEYLASTGAVNRTVPLVQYTTDRVDADFFVYGVARSPTYIYVLYFYGRLWQIDQYLATTLAPASTLDVTNSVNNKRPGISWDGTNINLITTTTSGPSASIRVRKYTEILGTGTNVTFTGPSLDADRTRLGGGVLATNLSQTYYYISIDDASGAPREVRVFDSTGAQVANTAFGDGAATAPDDVTYNQTAGVFYTLPGANTGEYHRHNNVFGLTDNTNKVWLGYTWYDSVGTAHETNLSPPLGFSWPRRANAVVTWPNPPTNLGGVNDVDSVRIYAVQNATNPGTNPTVSYKRQGANITVYPTPVTSITLTTLDTTTTTASIAAFLNVTNPGKLVSGSGRFSIGGTDVFLQPKLCVQSVRAGNVTLTTGSFSVWTPASLDLEYLWGALVTGDLNDPAGANPTQFKVPTGFSGIWQMTAQMTFSAGANAAGRTEVKLTKNVGATQIRLVIQPGSDAQASQVLVWRGALVAGDYVEISGRSVTTARDMQGTTNAPNGVFALWEYVGD